MTENTLLLDSDGFPRIEPVWVGEPEPTGGLVQRFEFAKQNIKQFFPKKIFSQPIEDTADIAEVLEQLNGRLPCMIRTELQSAPGALSFFLLSRHRPGAFKFFYEMLSHWLVPGRRLSTQFFSAVDFRLPDLGSQVYTLSEMVAHVEDEEHLEAIRKNLPIVETELCLGAESVHHARRILEVKGFSVDEKTATIQEHVARLFSRRPEMFDPSVFTEMQHILVLCRDDFKKIRECRHISRIIGIHHHFRRRLRDRIHADPERRHLFLKIIKSRLHQNEGARTVLGIIVGLNFLQENELLEERHILKAVQNYVPNCKAVDGSFLSNTPRNEPIGTLYVEVEKTNGEEFSVAEVRRLRRSLPSDLKDRVEHLMHPVFMPRNEEEIMKNILTLSGQIKYLRDIPQVMISFDQQTDRHLSFCVIWVRILKKDTPPLEEVFKGKNSRKIKCQLDQARTVGYLRKQYRKEANVFHVRLTKKQFLRPDHSLDLNKARQMVVDELTKLLGEFRDYNGGMISKQNELLCLVRDSLGEVLQYNEFLLENFFYSLTPVVMRSVLEPRLLKELFLLLLQALEDGFFQGEGYSLKTKADDDAAYALLTTDSPELRKGIEARLAGLGLDHLQLASTFVNVYDTPRLGYILRSSDPKRQREFIEVMRKSLMEHYEAGTPAFPM